MESGDCETGTPTSGIEKLFSGMSVGLDEIHPGFLITEFCEVVLVDTFLHEHRGEQTEPSSSSTSSAVPQTDKAPMG